jgi:hypothetical protein
VVVRRNGGRKKGKIMRASLKMSVLVLLLAGFFGSISSTLAQPFVIFGYTNQLWKYNTANIDGTGWEAAAYDDTVAGWSAPSRGSFGSEDTAATITALNTAGATINTPIALEASGSRLTTWYFRTHFNLATSPTGVSLIFTNRVDDGVVVYLNGQEIYRTGGIVGTPPVYAATAANTEATTVQIVTTNQPASLVQGDNVLAVRLHQTSTTSSDKVFALALSGATQVAPVINYAASSLTNRTVAQCVGSTTLSVSASGFPVPTYQWFKDNVAIANATNATYAINNAPASAAGNYYVFVSNVVGTATSTPDTVVTVTPDTTPPSLLLSHVSTNLTNLVLYFSEAISTNCGACGELYANVILVDTNTGNQVATLAGQTYFSGSRVVAIYTDGTPLDISHGYDITISLVEDACAGIVLPDTTYPVGRLTQHLISFDTTSFKFDINNGDRTGTGWQSTGFDDSAWPSGVQGLGHESDTNATNVLLYPIGTPGTNGIPIRTHLNYMSNGVVAYFRTHFTSPVSPGANVGLVLYDVVEDGAVYYLNGVELHRTRLPAGTLTFTTLANGAPEPTPINGPVYLTAPSLVAGDNVLAVAVHQSAATSSDLEMAVDLSVVSPQPVVVGPRLTIVRNGDGTVTVSWPGGGTLQQSTDLNSPSNWMSIIGQTSPYTTTPSGTQRFFRVTVP